MQVILIESVNKLGKIGDQVKVRPGFARNYLIPRRLALRATKENLAYFEAQRAQLEAANQEKLKAAQGDRDRLQDHEIILIRSAGSAGQLYGSVTARDIAKSLSDDGFAVTHQQVDIETPIKTLGLFAVRVVLHADALAVISVNVARSADEAVQQREIGGMLVQRDDQEDEQEDEQEGISAEDAAESEDVTAEGRDEGQEEEES